MDAFFGRVIAINSFLAYFGLAQCLHSFLEWEDLFTMDNFLCGFYVFSLEGKISWNSFFCKCIYLDITSGLFVVTSISLQQNQFFNILLHAVSFFMRLHTITRIICIRRKYICFESYFFHYYFYFFWGVFNSG